MNLVRTIRRFSELLGVVSPSQGGLPTGGATAQVLSKASGTDYDTHWIDAASGGSTPVPQVVEFRGESGLTPMQISHGLFWPPGVDLPGGFLWDLWCCPAAPSIDGANYVISDGYGGNHALLVGFNQYADATRLQTVLGNIFNGTGNTSWQADDGLYAGEWGHVAYLWDSANGFLYIYINGVPCMRTAFAGPRRSAATVDGSNDLFVGGSDHNNYQGRLAMLRSFEGSQVLNFGTPGERAFFPAWPLEPWAYIAGTQRACNFLADYTVPRRLVPDNSPSGYLDASGVSRQHPGVLYGSNGAAGGGDMRGVGWDAGISYPIPAFVADATFPFPLDGTAPTPPTVGIPSPPSTPPGCKVFDSFSRGNRCPAFGNTGLGSTEAGSLGPLPWSYGAIVGDAGFSTSRWGILHGAAVWLDQAGQRATAYVDVGSQDVDVRVDRKPGTNGVGARTGLCARLVDAATYWSVVAWNVSNDPTAQAIVVGYWTGGTFTQVAGSPFTAPASRWTTLRAVFSGTGLTVYCDSTVVASVAGIGGPTGTKAGLANDNNFGPAATSGLDRWDNFTVL